jgi:hypothetical protein
VDEPLSSHVADTNALDFTIENLEVKDADFENKTGVLFLEIFFDYSGEQDPDRAHHGSVFHVFATLMLARRDGQWNLSEPYGLEIHDVERDVDRAYRLDDTARQRLVSEGNGA